MLRRSMILAMASLLGACDSDGTTASSSGAAQIAFDSKATVLKGATVQAFGEALDDAVAATNAQLLSVVSRLDSLEGERDALSARASALETANIALSKRLQALEDQQPPVVDVLGTAIPGSTLPPGTLLSTLENLHASLTGLAALPAEQAQIVGALDSVEDALAALSTCPGGTTAVGAFCIESVPRTSDTWGNAVIVCGESGGHICSADEYSWACQNPPALGGGSGGAQLTSELVMGPGGYAGAALLFGVGDCELAGDPVDDNLTGHPYRCCYHRVVPGAGPPSPTN